MKILVKLTFLFLILSACSNSKPYGNLGSMNMIMSDESALEIKSSKNLVTDRKLIKRGRVEFETESLENTHARILEAVKNHQAYIATDRLYKNSYQLSNMMEIRIPAKNFNPFLSEISKNIEKFDSKEITVSDVTEQFLDTETRLKTKKELEKRYLEILKKAKSVSEILEVEKQIGFLRTEIESVEGRLKYLKNQVSFSALNITFHKTISSEINFVKKLKNGFNSGLDNLVWFFIFIINIWPFIIIFMVLIFFFRRWRKKRKNIKY